MVSEVSVNSEGLTVPLLLTTYTSIRDPYPSRGVDWHVTAASHWL